MRVNTPVRAKTEDVIRFAERVKDNWTLCEFFAGKRRASEAEYMVATTLHACKINLNDKGEAFSIRDDSVFTRQGGGLADNATAYGMLIDEGFIVEEARDGKVLIFVTQKLIDKLEKFFAKER